MCASPQTPVVAILDGSGQVITSDSSTTVAVSLVKDGKAAVGLTNYQDGGKLSAKVVNGVATFTGLGLAKGCVLPPVVWGTSVIACCTCAAVSPGRVAVLS